ncbi:hypothetical protein HN011_003092 [Eciton burchellii]|nr:hypothetical protein HN011_003092 [Eciton burchellii]
MEGRARRRSGGEKEREEECIASSDTNQMTCSIEEDSRVISEWMNELKQTVTDAKATKTYVNQKTEKIMQRIIQMQDKMQKMQDENAKMQDENAKMQDENAKMQDKMQKMQDENAKMQNKLAKEEGSSAGLHDVNSDRRQANLKGLLYNLEKADWEKLHEELTKTEPSSLSSNPKEAMMEFINWITNACVKTIPITHIDGWRKITWWTSDLAKMRRQTNLYRRRLKKTLDSEARERAQNAFRDCLNKYKTALRAAKGNVWKKYVEDNMKRDPWFVAHRIVANKLITGNMSTVKKADGSMTADWQETVNEMIKCLFLKDEALEGDRLCTEEEDVVEMLKNCKGRNATQQPSWETRGRGFPANANSTNNPEQQQRA